MKLNIKPFKKYSQTGEEGVLLSLFERIGTTNNYLVDFGAGDGFSLSNSQYLLEQGWTGLRMDGNAGNDVKSEFITAENIVGLLDKYGVPIEFDLLCLDIDGNDYWVLKSLLSKYSPRAIVLEVNGCLPVGIAQTVEYSPNFSYGGDDYYGASYLAFQRLCSGYTIVYNQQNLNLFLVRNDVVGDITPDTQELCTPYHSHNTEGVWVIDPDTTIGTTDRFPSDYEQPTESLAELREQIVAVNKEYMTCTDQAIRSQLKDKVKEVTDKLRKMESEIGSTFSSKSAYENLKKAEQLEQPKKKRGRPSKK
jgi:hypothetical protein